MTSGPATLPDPDPRRLGPGLYVHVPFCARKCHYCDFTAYVHRAPRVARFVEDLAAEAALYAADASVGRATFRSVFFGGGTPSILTPAQFGRVMAALRSAFRLAPDAEITLEANPEDLIPERLAAWRESGVNRLSVGVQAAQPRLLQALGRNHGWAEVERGYGRARREGFEDVNLDLMFGLPGQRPADWRETLDRVLDLDPAPPSHLSCYGLQVEEHTLFGRWRREGRLPLPADETERHMCQEATAVLARAGYRHYELSNFARPGRRSRHNLNYWAGGEYLGLGPGAWSFWRGRRFGNEHFLRPYGEAVAAGRCPVAEVDDAGRRTRMAEALMLGTRLVAGMPVSWFVRRFGAHPADCFGRELERLQARGLLTTAGGRLRLTAEGRMLANEVWLALL